MHLPRTEALLADQQHEGGRLGDFLGELRQPEAAGAQALGREEDVRVGVLAPQRRLERLHQREVLRVVAQEPAPHAGTVSGLACNFVDQIRKLPPAE